jgi:multimeric flavodoxin WrbA
MSALMKTFFDRFSDLITYRKTTGRQLKGKSTLLIAVGADQYLPDGYEIPFKSTSEYLDMNYLGHIYHCTKNELPDLQQIQDFIRKLNGNN